MGHLRVLWLGGVFGELAVIRDPGISPAGNRWQLGIIEALVGAGVEVRVIGHKPEPLWPKGRVKLCMEMESLSEATRIGVVGYYNLPGLRKYSLRRGFVRYCDRILSKGWMPDVVISYNNIDPHVVAAERICRINRCSWVNIVADQIISGEFWPSYEAGIRHAHGHVFLSHGTFSDCRLAPKFHLDGGVKRVRWNDSDRLRRKKSAKMRFLFTGGFGAYGGINQLIDAFRDIKNNDIELIICGKGEDGVIKLAAANDKRIQFMGMVPELELEKQCRLADVFVNPRPDSRPENRHNFPSKLFEYLAYGKPIISTWTDGLSPSYKSLLLLAKTSDAFGLGQAISRAIAISDEEYVNHCQRIREVVLREKMWNIRVNQLLEWIDEFIIQPKVLAP